MQYSMPGQFFAVPPECAYAKEELTPFHVLYDQYKKKETNIKGTRREK